MALESYNAKYYEKSQAMYKAATQNSDTNLDDKIDIS
jgi:hypothetical protein